MSNHSITALSYETPRERLFELCRPMGHAVLLTSGVYERGRHKDHAQLASSRYDIISASPAHIYSKQAYSASDQAALISRDCEALLSSVDEKPSDLDGNELPFAGGAIGFVSYSGAAATAGITLIRNQEVPALFVGIYQWAIIVDHQNQRCTLVIDKKLDAETRATLDAIFLPLKDTHEKHRVSTIADGGFQLETDWQSNTDLISYARKFQRVKDYVLAGDTYQINLSIEHSAEFRGDPWHAFKRLSERFGAPYAGYLQLDNMALASFSPERFIRIDGGKVITQPIKGTRKRHCDSERDSAASEELLASAKDRAENLMIVDLMRNDIGKHCISGSVEVPKLFELQSFSNVHHLVSTVTGQLAETGLQASLTALLDALPGGSVTGAPKHRSMEIIEELEEHDRTIYCGSLFYATLDGTIDSNILIRSLLFFTDDKHRSADGDSRGTVSCWGGSGLVADSLSEQEYEESLYKVDHLLQALTEC